MPKPPASAPAPVAKADPPAVRPSVHSAAPAVRAVAPSPSQDVKVVKWGDNGPRGFATPPNITAPEVDPEKGVEGNAGQAKTDAKGEPEAQKTEAAKTEEPKKPAETRRDTLARLEAERKVREIETAAKKDREELAALRKALDDSKKAPLRERLKQLAIDKDELLERLLKKDADLEPLPQAKEPEETPREKALREKLEAVEKRLAERDGSDENAQVARAVAGIAEQLKEADLPMVNSDIEVKIDGKTTMTPHQIVLNVAHQMWLDSGKSGHPRDYVADAGKNVEGHLREKYPKLAARLGSKEQEREPEPPPRSIGRRTGAGGKGELPELPPDRGLRDILIKREMGWL